MLELITQYQRRRYIHRCWRPDADMPWCLCLYRYASRLWIDRIPRCEWDSTSWIGYADGKQGRHRLLGCERECGGARPSGSMGGRTCDQVSLLVKEGAEWLSNSCRSLIDHDSGQAIIITRNKISRRQVTEAREFAPDIFEFVYFARPDSTLDGISVYRSRMAMGEQLAETAKIELKKARLEVDVVIPVPDTSRSGGFAVSTTSGDTVSGGVCEKSIRGTDIHHAWAEPTVSMHSRRGTTFTAAAGGRMSGRS